MKIRKHIPPLCEGFDSVEAKVTGAGPRLIAIKPKEGWLFPTLAEQNDQVRASRFRKRRDRLGFKDISF